MSDLPLFGRHLEVEYQDEFCLEARTYVPGGGEKVHVMNDETRRSFAAAVILEWEASLERIGYGTAFSEISTEAIATFLKENKL